LAGGSSLVPRQSNGKLIHRGSPLSGTPSTANHKLVTDILRNEWGFDGFVVSDWNSVEELIRHGVAEDSTEAAVLSLKAGVDMESH